LPMSLNSHGRKMITNARSPRSSPIPLSAILLSKWEFHLPAFHKKHQQSRWRGFFWVPLCRQLSHCNVTCSDQ
jgi:hypothetical protein